MCRFLCYSGSPILLADLLYQEVYKDLARIAKWIMPTDERPTTYEIQPFDRTIHYVPGRKLLSEVSLNIKITHRHGFDQPVDDCEQMCLKEMRRKLAELGVKEGGWKDEKQ